MKNSSITPNLPPQFLVEIISLIRSVLQYLHDRMFPQNVVLYEYFQYFHLLPCLYTAAELDLARLLRSGPRHADELARETGVESQSLYRVLRALAGYGIFRETKTGVFSLTSRAKPLLEENGSLRYMILHHLSPLNWQMNGDLPETVRTGKDGFTRRFGHSIYDYLRNHPEAYAIFDKSMGDLSSLGLAPLLQACRFASFGTLADIGGGEGILLCNILQQNPGQRGILFDLPEALVRTPEVITRYGLNQRITIREGNFFDEIPVTADGYILKNILHNWADEKALLILQNIRKVIPSSGKLLVIEMVIPTGNTRSFSKMIDIQMLATMPGGKERTRQEFNALFLRSGFMLRKVHRTISPVSILETIPDPSYHI